MTEIQGTTTWGIKEELKIIVSITRHPQMLTRDDLRMFSETKQRWKHYLEEDLKLEKGFKITFN